MDNSGIIKDLIAGFEPNKLTNLLRRIAPDFRPAAQQLGDFIQEGSPFATAGQLGVIELANTSTVLVAAVHVLGALARRSSKRKQYELAKRILKDGNHNAGIFAFYGDGGHFRLSLVTIAYHGTQRKFSAFRRYTFFVDPALPNKTFLQQMRRANFSTFAGILQTFSLEAVSDEFYKEFEPQFDALASSVKNTSDGDLQKDFALLFVIRIIFLGFVQKKGWLAHSARFLQDYWEEYRRSGRNRQVLQGMAGAAFLRSAQRGAGAPSGLRSCSLFQSDAGSVADVALPER